MKHVTCTTKADLEAIDAKALAAANLGPPVRRGGGLHAPPEQCVTLRWGHVRKHPARSEWAYPVDATAKPFIDADRVAGKAISAEVDLPKEWTPGERLQEAGAPK